MNENKKKIFRRIKTKIHLFHNTKSIYQTHFRIKTFISKFKFLILNIYEYCVM